MQPGAPVHRDPPAHEEAGHILAKPVVVARHDGEPVGDGGGEPAEGGELLDAAAVGHVAGHHDLVDAGLDEGRHEGPQGGGVVLAAAEVQVGEVRQGPGHGGLHGDGVDRSQVTAARPSALGTVNTRRAPRGLAPPAGEPAADPAVLHLERREGRVAEERLEVAVGAEGGELPAAEPVGERRQGPPGPRRVLVEPHAVGWVDEAEPRPAGRGLDRRGVGAGEADPLGHPGGGGVLLRQPERPHVPVGGLEWSR